MSVKTLQQHNVVQMLLVEILLGVTNAPVMKALVGMESSATVGYR